MNLADLDNATRLTAARRSVCLCAGLLTMALVTGCASSPTPIEDVRVSSNDLYSGEPTVLHATEIPVGSAEEARARAAEALAERDVDLALYLYVQAVNLDAEDTESLSAIAAIHADRGNAELAGRAYARVVELDPDDAPAHQGLGLALFELRRFADAEQYLQQAVDREPGLWRSHNALGIIADRNEEYAAAVEHYSAAIAAQPSRASLLNNRGYSRYLAGEIETARADFLAALDIDPEYDRAWRNLGLTLAREEDYERALSVMSLVIDKHVALNDVGYIAMLNGNYQVAQSLFEEAVMVSPRHYQTAKDNLTELSRRRSSASQAALTVN